MGLFLRGEDAETLQATNELVDPGRVLTLPGPAIATAGGSPSLGLPPVLLLGAFGTMGAVIASLLLAFLTAQDAAGLPARSAAWLPTQTAAGVPVQNAAGLLAQNPAGPAAPEHPDAEAAFARLSAAEKADLIDYFRAEAGQLQTFQASLVKFVLGEQDRNPKAWGEEHAAPWFDAKEHTPENDIPRHPLEPDAPAVKTFAEFLRARAPKPRFASAWRYDYATRELVRSKAWQDPARIFQNGLAGIAPDLDLVEALVERALDDGSEQKALAAFGHAYTDRDGGVFTGITLYDAWGSGKEIETPDVDTLGIVHTVLGDFKTWHAPVPTAQHEKLFDKIGEIFLAAQRHRELRHALAAVFVEGSASVDVAYVSLVDNLHALWEDAKSTPAELAPRLPKPEKRQDFLSAWTKRCHSDGDLWVSAVRRHKTLDADGEAVKKLLLRLLDEFAPKEGAAKQGGKDH
jgi:hypothetical protein